MSRTRKQHFRKREKELARAIRQWTGGLVKTGDWADGDMDPWTSPRIYRLAARAAIAVLMGAREAERLIESGDV